MTLITRNYIKLPIILTLSTFIVVVFWELVTLNAFGGNLTIIETIAVSLVMYVTTPLALLPIALGVGVGIAVEGFAMNLRARSTPERVARFNTKVTSIAALTPIALLVLLPLLIYMLL